MTVICLSVKRDLNTMPQKPNITIDVINLVEYVCQCLFCSFAMLVFEFNILSALMLCYSTLSVREGYILYSISSFNNDFTLLVKKGFKCNKFCFILFPTNMHDGLKKICLEY